MNRIIKFRGKRLDNGEWVYGSLLNIEDTCFIIEKGDFDFDYRTENQAFWFDCTEKEVNSDTIGQFTGLYDKKKMPIYEGDIVRYQDTMGYSFVSPVEFREGKFCMKTKYSNCITFSNKGRYNDGKCSFEYDIEHEVIGNIHDTPDLLNDK